MDITQIQISINKDEETLNGFKTTFIETNIETGNIIDTYTCTHGSLESGENIELTEIEPV